MKDFIKINLVFIGLLNVVVTDVLSLLNIVTYMKVICYSISILNIIRYLIFICTVTVIYNITHKSAFFSKALAHSRIYIYDNIHYYNYYKQNK